MVFNAGLSPFCAKINAMAGCLASALRDRAMVQHLIVVRSERKIRTLIEKS